MERLLFLMLVTENSKHSSVYFSTFNSFTIVPNIGVFPKWLLILVGSTHILTALLSIIFMLTRTSGTGPCLMVIVAVPLYTVVELFGIDISAINHSLCSNSQMILLV